MATITVNPDNTLSLNLNDGERLTYDATPAGQLAEFVTLWLDERFKESWRVKIAQLSKPQKVILAGYLSDVADLKPGRP